MPGGKLYILSAFSLAMLPLPESYGKWFHLWIEHIDPFRARKILFEARQRGKEIISAVGHESTAKALSALLNEEIPVDRRMIKIEPGDAAIVFQLFTRLPEGKVLSEEEVWNMWNEGKIKLLYLELSEHFY